MIKICTNDFAKILIFTHMFNHFVVAFEGALFVCLFTITFEFVFTFNPAAMIKRAM